MARSHRVLGQGRRYRDTEYVPLVGEDMHENVREESAKHAATVLYGALPQTSYPPRDVESPHSQSFTSSQLVYNEREMKFSSVRRMFCLVTLFDLLFIFLLWMLHASVSVGLQTAFRCQLQEYNIKTSLFDIVLLSAARMVLLLLAYALCKSKHWFTVAFTTFATCAFLIAKVIVFDWNQHSTALECKPGTGSTHPLDYIIFLMSFSMAWIETWVLDWKVIPREKKIAELYERQTLPSEREPLLPDFPQRERRYDSSDRGTEFYSPVSTPVGSETESDFDSDEGNEHRKTFHSLPASQSASLTNLHLLAPKDQEYFHRGKDAMEKMLQILQSEDGWKLEKENKSGVTVYTKDFGGGIGRIYKMQGIIQIDARLLFEELFYRLEDSPRWNPTIADAKILHTIDEHTDISYNQAAESTGGIVATRDFVTVRHWQLVEGMYISSGQAVEYEGMPPKSDCVRGTNGPGGWAIKVLPGKPAKCQLTWILNTDLKFQGWMPQYIIDQALTGVLVDIYKYVTHRVEQMKSLNRTL